MEYECKKCGCTKVFAKPAGRSMGVYCQDCGAWIANITYTKMKDLYNKISKEDLGENAALRNIKKRNSVITMKCTNCGCLLFNSLFPHPQGQFNLLNAGFCPSCGKRLI